MKIKQTLWYCLSWEGYLGINQQSTNNLSTNTHWSLGHTLVNNEFCTHNTPELQEITCCVTYFMKKIIEV